MAQRTPRIQVPYVTPPGCRLVCWLQQPTGLAGLNGWRGWLKPDPDRSALNYGLLTRSTRPRWYQPSPDPKPLWWRETRREPPAVCNAGRGLEKENIIIKLLAVPPGPCRAGHGRLRFLPNSILGCASCAGLRMDVRRCRLLFGLSLMGSALPVGCVGFSAGARC